jgi:nucleoside-diphosphate-sugar epimerase
VGERLDVLLIGGTGFLGWHVARALTAAGHRVTALSRGRRNLPPGVKILVADRCDPASLARALEGQRFELTLDLLVYDAPDVEILLLVPHAALGRYVMVSSGQVYLVTEGCQPPYREEDADGPLIAEPSTGTLDLREWSYGVGKRRAEQRLLGLRGTHGLRAVALRLPIIQGEGDTSLRLWSYLERMLDGGPLLLPEGGSQLMRFVDAADVARAVVWLVTNPPPQGVVYNLAQPDVITLRQFLERLAAEAGLHPRFVEAPWDDVRAAELDDAFSPYAGKWRSLLDPARAAADWGFEARRVEDYLPRVVRWHLENRPQSSHPGYAQRALEIELANKFSR